MLGTLAACTPLGHSGDKAGSTSSSGGAAGAPEPFPAAPSDAGTVAVFPPAGARFAPPQSEVSLRGPRLAASGPGPDVRIEGSQSGSHTFTVHAHADGAGMSLVPAAPFEAGESVTVTTGLDVLGATSGRTTFTVARVQATAVGPDNEGVDASQVQVFASAPDLSVPKITVQTDAPTASPGRIFLSPYRGPGVDGPMLLDDHGGLLWSHPVPDGQRAANFQAQTWRGRPVLTWWQGVISQTGDSTGVGYVYDQSYRQVAEVTGSNGLSADLHEFQITAEGTALLLSYMHCQADLSAAGGPADGLVIDGVVQEVEIDTGRVLFEWHALDHIALTESFQPMSSSASSAWDAFHLNSVAKGADGSYLLSSRATHTIYRLDGHSGQVLWRLGGRRSNFRIEAGAGFSSQHDARWLDADTISLFDNAAGVGAATAKSSSALVLRLDTAAQTAARVTIRSRGASSQSASQGSTQVLADRHIFVGWGSQPYLTEYDASGAVVFAAAMPSADQSYRAFRLPWTGHPETSPQVASIAAAGGHEVSVSWNGATEVAQWQVLTGPSPGRLAARKTLPRNGFETTLILSGLDRYLAVRALDSRGRRLGTSDPITT